MKNYYSIFLAVLLSVLFSGCNKDETEGTTPQESPVIRLISQKLEVPNSGGDFKVNYIIDNPVENVTEQVQCDVQDWISGLAAENGTISFTVAENEVDKVREAKVTLSYEGAESVNFQIIQSAGILPPELTIDPESMKIKAEGGFFSIDIHVANPVEGAVAEASTEEKWITKYAVKDNKLEFQVISNISAEPRKGEIKITYPGALKSRTLSIEQEAKSPDTELFTINVNSIDQTFANVDIIPWDKEMPYLYEAMPEADFNAAEDENAIFDKIMANIKAKIDLIYDSSVPLSEYLKTIVKTGDLTGQQIVGLTSGTKYVFFVYALDCEKVARLSDFVKVKFETVAAKPEQIFSFDIQIDGINTTIDVDPGEYAGKYYMTTYKDIDRTLSSEELEKQIFSGISEMIEMYKGWGMSIQDILSMSMFHTGAYTYTSEQDPDTEYMAAAFTLDENGNITSTLNFEFYKSGTVPPSENVITFAFSNIKSRSAKVKVIPSNQDYYRMKVVPASELEYFSSDEEIIDYVNNLNPAIRNGEYEETFSPEAYQPLSPDTEYRVIAFGMDHYVVTTGLFMDSFRTAKHIPIDIQFNVECGVYYDGKEIAELDPDLSWLGSYEQAVMPIKIATEPNVDFIRYQLYNAQDLKKMSEEDICMDLLKSGYFLKEFSTLTLDYNKTYVMVILAKDAEDNYTDLWKSENMKVTKAGVSPAQEYVDKY